MNQGANNDSRAVGASDQAQCPAQSPGRRQALGALAGLGGAPLLAALTLPMMSGCMSLVVGGDPPQALQWKLLDAARAGTQVRRQGPPLVAALLLQSQSSDAMLDSTAMAYSPRAGAFAAYQYATWTERPARQLQRLLQQRLLAAGVAGTVAALGEPLNADWLLNIKLDELHHATQTLPGSGRVVLQASLIDRRKRTQPAQRRFQADVAAPTGDVNGAVQALSQALAQVFDELVPWMVTALQRAEAPAAADKGGQGG